MRHGDPNTLWTSVRSRVRKSHLKFKYTRSFLTEVGEYDNEIRTHIGPAKEGWEKGSWSIIIREAFYLRMEIRHRDSNTHCTSERSLLTIKQCAVKRKQNQFRTKKHSVGLLVNIPSLIVGIPCVQRAPRKKFLKMATEMFFQLPFLRISTQNQNLPLRIRKKNSWNS